MALELKHVIETNQIRVSYHCISISFHFGSSLKQLYISNKTECFSYKGRYGIHKCTRIELFKSWLGLHINGFKFLVIYNSYITKKLEHFKFKTILYALLRGLY